MNPGVSDVTTGVLPSRRAASAVASTTAGSVIGTGQFAQTGGRPDARQGKGRLFVGHLTLLRLATQEAADAVPCPLVGAGNGVVHQDLKTGLCGDLRDAGSHRPGSQHADLLDVP